MPDHRISIGTLKDMNKTLMCTPDLVISAVLDEELAHDAITLVSEINQFFADIFGKPMKPIPEKAIKLLKEKYPRKFKEALGGLQVDFQALQEIKIALLTRKRKPNAQF